MSKWDITHNSKQLESCRINGTYQTIGNALFSVNNEFPGNIMTTSPEGEIRVYYPNDDTLDIMNDHNGDKAILIIKQHIGVKHGVKIQIEVKEQS